MTPDHCGPACPFLACLDCRYQPEIGHQGGTVNHEGPCPTCSEPGSNCPNDDGEACCLPCYEHITTHDLNSTETKGTP